MRTYRFSIVLTCLFFCHSAMAVTNGMASYSELGREQFIARLNVEETSASPTELLASTEKQSINVRITADKISSRRFRRLWIEGLAVNANREELTRLASDIAKFNNMLKIPLKQGDEFSVLKEQTGSHIALNGIELGQIDNPEFFSVLLRTWLGRVPLSSSFRAQIAANGIVDSETATRFESTQPAQERITQIQAYFTAQNTVAETPVVSQPAPIAITEATPQVQPTQVATPEPTEVAIAATPEPTPQPTIESTPKPALAAAPQRQQPVTESSLFTEEEESEDIDAQTLLERQLYISELLSFTQRNVKYPKTAILRGYEGNIRLEVTITADGKLVDYHYLEKSRYRSLNQAAVVAVKKSASYPPLPESINERPFSFTIPFVFALN